MLMGIMERPTPDIAQKQGEETNSNSPKEVAPSFLPDKILHESTTALNSGSAGTTSNGSNNNMPPQQVYVNSDAIAGLEHQFMSLGMNSGGENGEVHQESNNTTSSDNDGEQNSEDEPVKLFVGQIPKSLSEEDIFPTFSPFGPLKDVAIIRDKHSGLHRGCAFVTYWSSADAEQAVEALHDKFTFEGGRRPAQVKPAEPSVPENKLFIGMLARTTTEEDLQQIFSPFGEIREIYMIRNSDGSSRCAAFLRYVERESASDAIENLNGTIVMEGSSRPLIVKFADNKHQRQARHYRNNRREQMMAAMGAGGPTPYPPPYHPAMGMPPAQYSMPPQYPYGPAGGPPPPGASPYMYPPPYAAPPYPYQNRQDMHPHQHQPRPREGPAGANLFVYHLPHDLTDADLATAFNPFGNVISAKVYVDKYTGESKGFGFVSYDSVMSAESAIEQMNGFQIGNKRLKVQHKRVNQGGGPGGMLPPQHLPHNALPPHAQGNGYGGFPPQS